MIEYKKLFGIFQKKNLFYILFTFYSHFWYNIYAVEKTEISKQKPAFCSSFSQAFVYF